MAERGWTLEECAAAILAGDDPLTVLRYGIRAEKRRADAAEALSDRLETAARAYIEGHELAMTRAEAAEEALAAAQLEVGVLKTALMDFQDAADQHGFKCEPYLEPDQHGSWLGVFNADNCPMCMGRAAPDGHGHGFPT